MTDSKRAYALADRIQAAVLADELDRAVELLEEFLDLEGTDRIWGLGMLQSVLGRLREEGVDAQTEAALLDQEQSIRADLLARDEGDGAWMHRWETARQLNNQAWPDLQAAKSRPELEAALELAERSLDFWPYFLPHQDTRVRCLLALGRDQEAFACVRWVEAIQPGWPDFADVRASRAYGRWLEAHRNEPVELPEGQATLSEVLSRLDPKHASPQDQPLNTAERMHLRKIRSGKDEWHRARNAALMAVLLDGDLPFDELLGMAPQAADLTRRVYRSDQGELPIGFDSLAKLRYWLLYGFTNHPVAQAPNSPPGMRTRLFIGPDLEGMTRRDVEVLLAEIGEKVGIDSLTIRRCRPQKIAGFERCTGHVRKPTP